MLHNYLWDKIYVVLGIGILSEMLVKVGLGLHIHLWDNVLAI